MSTNSPDARQSQTGIVCSCGDTTDVSKSKPVQGGIRRYRICRTCGVRYRTLETVQAIKPVAGSGESMAVAVPFRFSALNGAVNEPDASMVREPVLNFREPDIGPLSNE